MFARENGWRAVYRNLLLSICVWFLAISSAAAADKTPLAQRLTPDVVAVVYPDAERFGPEEGKPPAMAAYKGNQVVGYVFSTLDIVAAPGYSSIPFDVIAGVDLSGRIMGAKVVFHREPYILNDAIRAPKLDTFLARHNGYTLRGGYAGAPPPEFVGGATISARAMRGAILDSARYVVRSRSNRPPITQPVVDLEGFQLAAWDDMLKQGSIAQKRFTNADVAAALQRAGVKDPVLDVPLGPPGELYTELFVGYATPPGVGRNLFGGRDFTTYMQRLPQGGHMFAIASNGPYDFVGTGYFSQETGFHFDRFRIGQGERSFEFSRAQFQRLGSGSAAAGIRGQRNAGLYFLGPDSGFDPLKPWRLDLLVNGKAASGPFSVVLSLPYQLPLAHIVMPDAEPTPVWVEAWQEARVNVAILAATLVVLTLILACQAQLTRYRWAHRWVRNGFLAFVLVWLGWYAGGQLSIINVMNYAVAPFRTFDIGFYLAEPIIVMIAVYTLVSLFLLGRGVFCGWLCPFGALQELLAQIARVLRLPQWNPSEALQRKLWMGKYASAVIVLGLAFFSLDAAATAAEVEPFKTAITSMFTRAWPFVAYAVALLAVGLFTERAYCRFLCPLGGALAILDRLHLIDMLKRRPECGNPCRLCERSCPVKAIERSGKIKMAECFQCLDCQVEYYDDRRCPPLAQARNRRARNASAGSGLGLPVPVAARGAAAE